jgi:hypothetical protein
VEERLRASLHEVEVAVAVEVHERVAGVGGDLAAAPAHREEIAVADEACIAWRPRVVRGVEVHREARGLGVGHDEAQGDAVERVETIEAPGDQGALVRGTARVVGARLAGAIVGHDVDGALVHRARGPAPRQLRREVHVHGGHGVRAAHTARIDVEEEAEPALRGPDEGRDRRVTAGARGDDSGHHQQRRQQCGLDRARLQGRTVSL